jgi:hypothetical protein
VRVPVRVLVLVFEDEEVTLSIPESAVEDILDTEPVVPFRDAELETGYGTEEVGDVPGYVDAPAVDKVV